MWNEMIGEECLAVIVYLAVLNTRALSDVLSSCRSRPCWQVAVCRAVNAIFVVCRRMCKCECKTWKWNWINPRPGGSRNERWEVINWRWPVQHVISYVIPWLFSPASFPRPNAQKGRFLQAEGGQSWAGLLIQEKEQIYLLANRHTSIAACVQWCIFLLFSIDISSTRHAQHFTLHATYHPLLFHPHRLYWISIPHPALLRVWNRSVVQQINTLAHASLTAFPHPCPFHSPAPWFPMQTCSSLCFILSGFPVSSVILGCSSLEPSFVYIYVKGRRPIEPCRMNSLMHNDDGGTRLSAVRFSDLGCVAWV